MLRYRGPSKKTIEVVKSLDAFPKVSESYVKTSTSGATISIITFLFITFLVVSEIAFYFDTRFEYDYKVDVEYDAKVWLNFDMTVATHCSLIGADVVDVTGQAKSYETEIVQEVTKFELTPEAAGKRHSFVALKHGLQKFNDGHKLTEITLKHGLNATKLFHDRKPNTRMKKGDACRFFGNIPLTKVAGNFHVVAGKPMNLFGGHAHLSLEFSDVKYNFSHRIDHLSFGDLRTGLINPLDGDEKISEKPNYAFQYYLDIVSTKIKSRKLHADTYQFSVTELSRDIDHSSGSHGMSGLFFKYDFSPLCVSINEHHIPFGRFFVRLCGIIGGVFATSCIFDGLFNFFQGLYKDSRKRTNHDTGSDKSAQLATKNELKIDEQASDNIGFIQPVT